MHRSLTSRFSCLLVLGTITLLPTSDPKAAPKLYTNPNAEAPVRGGPNDILLLPGADFGSGDEVVYRREGLPTGGVFLAPTSVPGGNTYVTGVAAVVDGYANVPKGLVVQLPNVVTAEAYYSLWVHSASGQWSAGLRINEPRPMWITPDLAYSNTQVAGLPRQLKVVGRNLQPRPDKTTCVRLTAGAVTYYLPAQVLSSTLSPYVALVTLESGMPIGNYDVAVSRDAAADCSTGNWVPLPPTEQKLQVVADPAPLLSFNVGNYGIGPSDPCVINDGIDDTRCVQDAIHAAFVSGGGNVVFGGGGLFGFSTWQLDGTNAYPPIDPQRGIVLPPKVNLEGKVAARPTVLRLDTWPADVVFTLQGANRITGLRFRDAEEYTNDSVHTTWNPYFRLGALTSAALPGDPPPPLEDIQIFDNVFEDSFMALGTGGFPLRRLYLVNNTFSAFFHGFYIVPPATEHNVKFRLDDSVIVGNSFLPSYYFDPGADQGKGQGSIATQLGSAYRLDFSNNTADGRDTTYIRTAPPGWRASFFWSAAAENEMILASSNTGYCSGDRSGYGEFIDYDENLYVGAATNSAVNSVLSPFSSTTAKISGPLRVPQSASTSYYVGFWAQVVDGRGLGQSRKIASYTTNPSTGEVTFTIAGTWTVMPDSTSKVVIVRPYMRVFTADNLSFNGQSDGCTMNNANAPKGGGIQAWGSMANSVFEGNVLQESDGVKFVSNLVPYSVHVPPQSLDNLYPKANLKFFVDVRSNTVDREYDWDDTCSWSGIDLFYGTGPGGIAITQNYGINVAQNMIDQADGLVGGGFQSLLGYVAPPGVSPPCAKNTIVQSNTIKNIQEPKASTTRGCDSSASSRLGIALSDPYTTGTVFYNNTLTNNATPMCEAAGTASVFVGGAICSGTCPTCP